MIFPPVGNATSAKSGFDGPDGSPKQGPKHGHQLTGKAHVASVSGSCRDGDGQPRAASAKSAAGPASPAPVEQGTPAPNLTLYAPFFLTRTFRLTAVKDGSPGAQIQRFSELYDKPSDGALVGEVRSVGTSMLTPFLPTPFSIEIVEYQVISLEDGIIYGMGTLQAEQEAGMLPAYLGWFAVTGGTAKYTGVQGRYQLRFFPAQFGGDNTAQIDLYTYNQRTVFAPMVEKR